ncbi:MAG: GAF domain-containing protein [Verrucomicrobia bacterium]|nr:GAF domain-containing protein [Verrucomicrobiota bacterium]
MSDELVELRSRYERLTVLYQVSNTLHSTLDPQETLELILRETVRITHATSGSISLINPNTGFLEIAASTGLLENIVRPPLHIGEGITGWVARHGKPARVGNVSADPRYIMLRPDVCSELAVPLLLKDEPRGVINVDSTRPEAFSGDDQQLLEELALQASKVIQNTWLYEQLRLKARLFETLVSIGQTINSTLNLDDALQVITREAHQLMNAKMCSLLMLDETGEWLDLRASCGASAVYINKPRLELLESLAGTVVRRKKPIQVGNVQTSGRYHNIAVAIQEGLVSFLSVPLLYRGQAIGALNVYKGESYNFSNEEIRILSALAELSAIAIEKARLYERVVDAEEQLRQNEKLSALGLLAAEVAHEIRNPLTVMKMMFHSLDLKFSDEDPRARDAAIMGEKMEHLNKIVEQILDFARSAEPKLAPVNVNQLIENLGLLIRHKLRNQNIELIRHLDPAMPDIAADSSQLEQASLNLVLNAVEAMPHGGQLTITTRAGKKSVVIEFKDTGEGMSVEQRERAFTSLLNTTKAKGTGLGLAIVKRVVETHRGEIQLTSEQGKGTTITLVLPTA